MSILSTLINKTNVWKNRIDKYYIKTSDADLNIDALKNHAKKIWNVKQCINYEPVLENVKI